MTLVMLSLIPFFFFFFGCLFLSISVIFVTSLLLSVSHSSLQWALATCMKCFRSQMGTGWVPELSSVWQQGPHCSAGTWHVTKQRQNPILLSFQQFIKCQPSRILHLHCLPAAWRILVWKMHVSCVQKGAGWALHQCLWQRERFIRGRMGWKWDCLYAVAADIDADISKRASFHPGLDLRKFYLRAPLRGLHSFSGS